MTEASNRIGMQWIPATQWAGSPWSHDPRTLGIAAIGGEAPSAPTSRLPQATLQTPVFGDGSVVEVWSGRQTARHHTIGDAHCRENGEVLFASVSVAASNDEDAFGVATYVAYQSLLEARRVAGYPHLLRIWNSIPHINADDAGLERYRRFNQGRFKAYQEEAMPTQSGAPAACALGSLGGPLVLYCLASKTPPESIENPRQTSAYQYPQQYGPRAPNFSRAALWRGSGDGDVDGNSSDVLFISGTASIVGHQSLHHGNVVAQAHETLTNLQAIVGEAISRDARGLTTLSDLWLKAYIRHASDVPAVRHVLAGHGLDADSVLYLQADICRADLLVEIEAIGPRSAVMPDDFRTETSDTRDFPSRSSGDTRAPQESA